MKKTTEIQRVKKKKDEKMKMKKYNMKKKKKKKNKINNTYHFNHIKIDKKKKTDNEAQCRNN